jgi:hypothetical protein
MAAILAGRIRSRKPTEPMRRLAAFAATAVLAAACTAVPEPAPPPLLVPLSVGKSHGYEEASVGPELARVTYHGRARRLSLHPAVAQAELDAAAEESAALALWRAAELARARGRGFVAVVDRRVDTETLRVPGGYTHDPWYTPFPYPHYGRFYRPWAWPTPAYVPPDAAGRARATLTVRFEARHNAGNRAADAIAAEMAQRFGAAAKP